MVFGALPSLAGMCWPCPNTGSACCESRDIFVILQRFSNSVLYAKPIYPCRSASRGGHCLSHLLHSRRARHFRRRSRTIIRRFNSGPETICSAAFAALPIGLYVRVDCGGVSPFKITICDLKARGHSKYLPFAFTEQGIAMLSGILNSKQAIDVNIAIMRTFVQMRTWLTAHRELARKLEELERKYDKNFQVVFDAIKKMIAADERPRRPIGFRPPA